MALWAVAAGAYGAVLVVASLTMPIRRRPLVWSTCLAYALAAMAASRAPDSLGFRLVVPPALLLCGYWLSGFFFRDPQAWLESALLRSDAWVFARWRVDDRLRRSPRWVLELLEGSYAADYLVVGAGAVVAATVSTEAIDDYWNLVLTSELACYAALPWLRSRPPRALEPPGVMASRRPALRRLNLVILDRASVQANTLPSGHVAGAAAAAIAVLPIAPGVGVVLVGSAMLIGTAAFVGRYHYAVDCVTGAAVALIVAALV